MRPLFSATKMRPSEAKRTFVGLVRPLSAIVSRKPLGTVVALAAGGAVATAVVASRTATSGLPLLEPRGPPDMRVLPPSLQMHRGSDHGEVGVARASAMVAGRWPRRR